jgi:para-aminobenzoate synthetase component 1
MPRVIRVEPLEDDTPFPWAPPPGDVRAFAPLLHSPADDRGPWARWSYAPGPTTMVLRGALPPGPTRLFAGETTLREWDDPREALRWLGARATERPTGGPPFKGGWVGWLGYDLGRCFESLPTRARDDLQLPLFEFTHHDGVLAFDHVERRAYRVGSRDVAGDGQTVEWSPRPAPLRSNFTRESYVRAVGRAIEYIRAGDIFQVNLSQRFTAGAASSPGEIYRRLAATTPAWFGAFLTGDDYALICNSPELFLRVTPRADGSRTVLTRPIKGTRPRQPGKDVELLHSAKDQAELNMIIDLERNDLGRVCEIGSVKVTQPRTIEPHPTVYHGVATVEGQLRPEVTVLDLLRATFPGGSITGAPKIRAMEIIEELEPTRRGPYCGAIGYLSADGHVEFNIAIRTMIVKDGLVHIPVGGGIVADSDPADEYEETLVKARAMFAALGLSADDVRRA